MEMTGTTTFKTPPTKPGLSQFNPIKKTLENHFHILFLLRHTSSNFSYRFFD
jgi:hypothetical protein